MKTYKPSSELLRTAEEANRNEIRHRDWLAKSAMYRYENKHELDVSSEQEPYYGEGQANIAQASSTFTNMLANDPDYQKWLDNLDKTPF